MLAANTGAFEKSLLVVAQMTELHFQHMSKRIGHSGIELFERYGHGPAPVDLREHILLRQVIHHRRHK